MYMKPPATDDAHQETRLWPAAVGAVAVSIIAVVLFGLWPAGALDLAGRSAATLTQTSAPVAREAVNSKQ
jgi:hypothetical protein